MGDELIIVVFPEDRDVFIDGEKNGRTNQTLRVEEGRHTINLGDPRDYDPKWRRPLVTGTTVIRPLEVIFEKKSG